jgi:choloylglycine hydrolase
MRHVMVALAVGLVGPVSAETALMGSRFYFERTYAPNVVWVEYGKLDFSQGQPEMEVRVEQWIFSLAGDATSQLVPAKPFVFGANKG